MKNNKIISYILSISLALFISFSFLSYPCAATGSGVSADTSAAAQTDYGLFRTRLPLIILEDLEESSASMRVIDSGGDNGPGDEPRYSAEILPEIIRYENNEPRPKKDYFIFVKDSGESSQRSPLPGLASGNRWFLLGGAYDKSLIRNFLGYTLAKRVRKDAPAVRLCELLSENDGIYDYQGVYLLVEGIRDKSVAARRTDHYWEGLNQTVVSDGSAGIFVLQENWGGSRETASMGAAIDAVSGMFNSGDTNDYLQYDDVLDIASFSEYFLINELMSSYADMNESMYSYDTETRRLSIGPVLNFERALDNLKNEPMEPRRLKYPGAPFYRHMIIDSEFINELINVCKDNAAALSGAEIRRLIDHAVAEIGEAQERDWHRWQDFYFSGENALSPYAPPAPDTGLGADGIGYAEDGSLMVETPAYYETPENAPERIRQFQLYEQEIVKLKFYVNDRPAFVRRAILLLKNQDNLLTQLNAYGRNSIWALLFLAGFILCVAVVHRAAER